VASTPRPKTAINSNIKSGLRFTNISLSVYRGADKIRDHPAAFFIEKRALVIVTISQFGAVYPRPALIERLDGK
jgi:hypothetical protein